MARFLFFGFLAGTASTDVCTTLQKCAGPQDEASLFQMQKGTRIHSTEDAKQLSPHKVAGTDTAFVQTAASTFSAGLPVESGVDVPVESDDVPVESGGDDVPVESGVDVPVESNDVPVESGGDDVPIESGVANKGSGGSGDDVPVESGVDDKQSWMDSLSDAAQGVADNMGNVSEAFSNATGRDEYVAQMRSVVDQFSHTARKRMADAQEELEAQDVGETAKEVTAKASLVVADTGSAAAALAGQFCEQLRSAKQDVANLVDQMDSAGADEKPALSANLMPAVSFLSELTAGSADLMRASVDEFRSFKAKPAADEMALKPGTPLAPTGEVTPKPSLLEQDPDQTSQLAHDALDQADAALSMASSFAEQLESAVHGEQALMAELADANGNDVGRLQQAVIHASRGVALLLSGDFVAMESHRLAAEELRAAAWPKVASATLPAVSLAVWAACGRV